MKTTTRYLIVLLNFLGAFHTHATVHYVKAGSVSAVAPYTNWANAAATIQQAVDVASPGDQVLVTNGTYATGSVTLPGSGVASRVVVSNAVSIQSVNGPAVTIIQGFREPNNFPPHHNIRGAYLGDGASLIGFTVQGGGTAFDGDAVLDQSGGGAWCSSNNVTISNCVFIDNRAASQGGGVYYGNVFNSTFTTNSADQGGGAYSAALFTCAFTNNFATTGGGACFSGLTNCTLTGNSANDVGGGVGFSSVTNCLLKYNFAYEEGGGAGSCTMYDCLIVSNTSSDGGGCSFCTVYGSLLTGNTGGYGGAILGGAYNNCNIIANHGVGAFDAFCNNCIIVNNADGNWGLDGEIAGGFDHCCTMPVPDGEGNFYADPQLASLTRLSFGSPCRGMGRFENTAGVDFDGQAWLNPPSVGCDEFYTNTHGFPSGTITVDYTTVAVGFPVHFAANITGPLYSTRWEFGDATIVSNEPFATHTWAAPGNYPVILRLFSYDVTSSISVTQIVHVVAGVAYVSQAPHTPVVPYSSWATAATNIQDAIDVSVIGGTVLVTNGTYNTGGRIIYNALTNRVAINRIVTVKSVNGPAVTAIAGYSDPINTYDTNSVRCVYMTNGATLAGFTLTNGATLLLNGENQDGGVYRGGGVWCESTNSAISNCVITGCFASDSGAGAEGGTFYQCVFTNNHADLPESGYGGGVDNGALNNCILSGNSCYAIGGGANNSTLNNCVLLNNFCAGNGGGVCGCQLTNCTLVGNSAGTDGGGANFSALYNCIAYYNTCDMGANYDNSTVDHCCTTPLPDGLGNFTSEPLFVNQAGGDLRLASNSPCINSGDNASAPAGPDLAGLPRVVGTVDMGAYEFQTPGSAISYAWLQQFGFPTDGSADNLDPDHDGASNFNEWRAGTDPTFAPSALKMLPVYVSTDTNYLGTVVSWQSVPGKMYYVASSTNLSARPAFSIIQSNIYGLQNSTAILDSTATNGIPHYYRVGVQ